MTKWVYKIWETNTGDNILIEEQLNEYGKYGWELVSIETLRTNHRYTFKQPIVAVARVSRAHDINDPIASMNEEMPLHDQVMQERIVDKDGNTTSAACLFCGDPNCYEVRTQDQVDDYDNATLLPECYKNPMRTNK